MSGNGRIGKLQRRQQIRRQIIIGMIVLLLATVISVGFYLQRLHKEKDDTKEVVKAGHVEKSKEQLITVEEEEETEEEKLQRVKREAHAAGTPSKVIELLDKNDETVDFVAEYSQKKALPYAETIGADLVKGKIPHLLQWDERWGYAPYGTNIIAVSGCGPTCMSMVVAGLTGDVSVTPDKMAAYAEKNGYLDKDNNTLWLFMKEAGVNWKIKTREIAMNEKEIEAELTAGHPIICSVGKGDFTQEGHFIILTGYENGFVSVNDPFSIKNSNKTWALKDIADQIKAMWVYSM